jgi:hypothetical protein
MTDHSYTVIEFPATGATYAYENEYGVYRYSTYGPGSVLEGQEKRQALGRYGTLAEAKREHPEAEWQGEGSTGFRDIPVPHTAPEGFDPEYAGEVWDDADY